MSTVSIKQLTPALARAAGDIFVRDRSTSVLLHRQPAPEQETPRLRPRAETLYVRVRKLDGATFARVRSRLERLGVVDCENYAYH